MPEDYKELLRETVLSDQSFSKAVFSGQQHGRTMPLVKATLRPLLLKNESYVQFSLYDPERCVTKNYRNGDVAEQLDRLLTFPFKNLYVETAGGQYPSADNEEGQGSRPSQPSC